MIDETKVDPQPQKQISNEIKSCEITWWASDECQSMKNWREKCWPSCELGISSLPGKKYTVHDFNLPC